MSFSKEEFNALIKAYRERKWNSLHAMLLNYDPESIAKAEKYLGVDLSSYSSPIRVGVGQGKMKKYTKPHSKKWYGKKIKQAKTKGEKEILKAAKSARLAELKRINQKVKFQKIKEKTRLKRINQLSKLIKNRESLKRQLRRYGMKTPRQSNLPNKKYKYTGARIKSLNKSVNILKKLVKNRNK